VLRDGLPVNGFHHDALPDRHLEQKIGQVVADNVGVKLNLAVIVRFSSKSG
jgi:hypothetical protein